MEYTLSGVVLLIVIYLLTKINKLEGSIKGMKHTLDQVAKKVEIPENPVNDRLRELLKEGQDIKAIKEARESLGLSLLEGKEYVDTLKRVES